MSRFTFAAVIPTKNRPGDLEKAVVSVLAQRRPPDELLVVDQSPAEDSRVAVTRLWDGRQGSPRLCYRHDAAIAGLVAAKAVAVSMTSCDIVCFLEDDIVLEPTYFEEIERAFLAQPEMVGCSGVITNSPRQSGLYRRLHRTCFQGIFADGRLDLYEGAHSRGLVRSRVLWGGQTAWKREVFAHVSFDARFHLIEDIEFSSRVARHYGPCLWVSLDARLEHSYAPANRESHGARQRRTMREAVLYYRKRIHWGGATIGIVGASLWWGTEALVRSLKSMSVAPMIGYARGIQDGWSSPIDPPLVKSTG